MHHSTCTYLFLVLFVFHHHQFMIFTIMIAGFNAAGGAPDETEEARLTVLCTILLVLHMMASQADKKEGGTPIINNMMMVVVVLVVYFNSASWITTRTEAPVSIYTHMRTLPPLVPTSHSFVHHHQNFRKMLVSFPVTFQTTSQTVTSYPLLSKTHTPSHPPCLLQLSRSSSLILASSSVQAPSLSAIPTHILSKCFCSTSALSKPLGTQLGVPSLSSPPWLLPSFPPSSTSCASVCSPYCSPYYGYHLDSLST